MKAVAHRYLNLFLFSAATLPFYSLAAPTAVVSHFHHTSNVPVATAVEIPPGYSTFYISGRLPKLQQPVGNGDPRKAYGGDTRAQAHSVLNDIQHTLQRMGMDKNDIVKVQVFLAGVPELNNRMDAKGFADAYAGFFSRESGARLPARTLVQVASLAEPGMLVEIEVTAVKKK